MPHEVWRRSIENQPFREVAKTLQQYDSDNTVILIGLERNGRIVLNPEAKQKGGPCKVQRNDRLVVFAYDRPRLEDFKRPAAAASAS